MVHLRFLWSGLLAICWGSAFLGADPLPWPRGEVRYRFEASVGPAERAAFVEALGRWSGAGLTFVEVDDGPLAAAGWLAGIDRHLAVRIDPTLETFGSTVAGWGPWRDLVFNPAVSSPDRLVGNLTHEVGHVLGLVHEHQRADRDRYIAFPPGFLENLPPGRRADYALRPPGPGDDAPYDYDSVMHYSSNVDGNRLVRRDTGAYLPFREVPSPGDLAKIHRLYAQEIP